MVLGTSANFYLISFVNEAQNVTEVVRIHFSAFVQCCYYFHSFDLSLWSSIEQKRPGIQTILILYAKERPLLSVIPLLRIKLTL